MDTAERHIVVAQGGVEGEGRHPAGCLRTRHRQGAGGRISALRLRHADTMWDLPTEFLPSNLHTEAEGRMRLRAGCMMADG